MLYNMSEGLINVYVAVKVRYILRLWIVTAVPEKSSQRKAEVRATNSESEEGSGGCEGASTKKWH